MTLQTTIHMLSIMIFESLPPISRVLVRVRHLKQHNLDLMNTLFSTLLPSAKIQLKRD